MVKRLIAKKVRISDISNGKYFPPDSESKRPSSIITPLGERVSRVNVVGSVTDKFVSDDRKFATLTIDDGTGAVRAKVFREDVDMFKDVEMGDIVVVIGKLREYQNEVYINAENVNEVEPEYEQLRRLELLKKTQEREHLIDMLRMVKNRIARAGSGMDQLAKYAKKIGIEPGAAEFVLENREVDYKPKVLEVIESLDKGEGAAVKGIFENLDIPDKAVERTIDELLAQGYLYEPRPGKFKKV